MGSGHACRLQICAELSGGGGGLGPSPERQGEVSGFPFDLRCDTVVTVAPL